MRIIKTFILLAMSLCIGCMSNDTVDDRDVNEDSLYGHYRGTYDANTKEMRLFAQLRLGGDGGTTVRMVDGELTVDGETMSEVYGDEAFLNLLGTYYRLQSHVDEPSDTYEVTWKRGDGREAVNAIVIPQPVKIVEARPIPVSTGHDLVIEFESPDHLSGDEIQAKVRVTHRHEHSHGTDRTHAHRRHDGHTLFSKPVTSGNQVILSARETARIMPNDQLSIELSRTRSSNRVNGHDREGGCIEGIFISEGVELVWPQ